MRIFIFAPPKLSRTSFFFLESPVKTIAFFRVHCCWKFDSEHRFISSLTEKHIQTHAHTHNAASKWNRQTFTCHFRMATNIQYKNDGHKSRFLLSVIWLFMKDETVKQVMILCLWFLIFHFDDIQKAYFNWVAYNYAFVVWCHLT